jgi:FtsP/CotA-like multicopper oxidase with cupredoxin domain
MRTSDRDSRRYRPIADATTMNPLSRRVEFELVNRTMMAHPMHLHDHSFQVVAIDGRPIEGAVRDTMLVMPRARVRIALLSGIIRALRRRAPEAADTRRAVERTFH